jgi:hypothetical protein
MLADSPISVQAGRLEPAVQLPGTARYALLEFIANELPRWRDHPDRKPETSETVLSDQLCDHLNSAARTSTGWSRVQFRTEVPDEARRGRAIDLAPKPCGAVLIIEGRRHTQFDTLLPIECKRLPTPKEKGRDEREYVMTATGSTGGVQRFKFGHHGSVHRVAGMIGYVQEHTSEYWLTQVNGWIRDLAREANSGWSGSDSLHLLEDNTGAGLCRLASRHERGGRLEAIDIQHLWLKMN